MLWLVLEFLLYYARYQWNDVRGIDNDRLHPARHLRARLPVGVTEADRRRSVNTSLAAASTRVAIAVLVGIALGMVEAVAILAIAVCLSAAVYEGVRSRSTPRPSYTPNLSVVGVWLTVGLGYMIRVGLGLALVGIPLGSATMAVGLIWAYAFGTMYVLLSWALETSNHCARTGTALAVAEEARRKPHIAALVRFLDPQGGPPTIRPVREPISPSTPGHLGSVPALAHRTAVGCPWNLALIASAPLSSLLGADLAGIPSWPGGLVAAFVCLGGATGLRWSTGSPLRWAVAAAAGLVLALLAAGATSPWAAPIPWLAVAACYSWLRSSSYLAAMGAGAQSRAATSGT
ncbi:MAG TPA: hypothetical protein VFN92_10675 [Solirubrobacterales bacterium]|nr:hypothetical protein [Solirubrobacterales bacterium]